MIKRKKYLTSEEYRHIRSLEPYGFLTGSIFNHFLKKRVHRKRGKPDRKVIKLYSYKDISAKDMVADSLEEVGRFFARLIERKERSIWDEWIRTGSGKIDALKKFVIKKRGVGGLTVFSTRTSVCVACPLSEIMKDFTLESSKVIVEWLDLKELKRKWNSEIRYYMNIDSSNDIPELKKVVLRKSHKTRPTKRSKPVAHNCEKDDISQSARSKPEKTDKIKSISEDVSLHDKKYLWLIEKYMTKVRTEEIVWVSILSVDPFTKVYLPPAGKVKMWIEAMKKTGQRFPLHVYKEGDKYIMSYDYCLYYAYLIMKKRSVPVIVTNE